MLRLIEIFMVYSILAYCDGDLSQKLQICKRSSPQIDDCLKSSIQKALLLFENGIREYNIPSMNPIRIPEWVVKRGEVLTFDQVYTNVELHNYSYVTIKEVRSKINDKEIYLHLKCLGPSTMEVKCDYRYDNAVLEGVDVSSTGIMDYTYYEHEFDVNFFGEIRKNGNDDYMFIRKVEVNMTNIESFHIKYTSENTAASAILTKKIGDIMDVLFSTNVGGYSDMYAAGLKNIANSVLSTTPFDKLLPS